MSIDIAERAESLGCWQGVGGELHLKCDGDHTYDMVSP